MQGSEDLLLFRAVAAGARRATALRLLHDRGRSYRFPLEGEPDLWELHDATLGSEDEPVAVASTRPLGDGRRVRLVGLVLSVSEGFHTTAQRMIEELSDALRARGAQALVVGVPGDDVEVGAVLERSGLRRVRGEPPGADGDGDDAHLVWFDVEL